MKNIRIVIATFKNQITEEEVSFFRGSIIHLSENNPFFHNHIEESYHYAYPLVQYKCVDGHPVILGINEGGEAIKRLFEDRARYTCRLGNRRVEMELIGIRSETFTVQCADEEYTYTIRGWLPLNSHNYRQYLSADGLIEQVFMLERILIGNIISFAKGIDLYFNVPVRCRILQLENEKPYVFKKVELLSFSAKFCTNVSLPPCIGLGKSVSINNGVITLVK